MRVAELRFLVRAFDAVIMLATVDWNDVLFWTADHVWAIEEIIALL